MAQSKHDFIERKVRKPSVMVTTPLPASTSMTIRSSGVPSVLVRTWLESEGGTPINGIVSTC